MFYQSVKSAYKAGKVQVGLPAVGHGDRVSIQANGLIGLKAAFLSKPERLLLAELSKSDAQAAFRFCTLCGAALEPSTKAILDGEYHCVCGATYKVVSAISDASQLRRVGSDPDIILGNCSVRIFESTSPGPNE
ncbi:hypothetical protein [Pseudomonas amygdali]|uniref:hypothetical protein n=1 Tax=Pseudomonas amygdali TaxID=47877 RepID=UPI0006E5E299|nr:hypothetical protein [Pseudomonas amygdali]KPY55678.1 hypothetical protein ALO93_200192 [Pseudomonas amygdali pv. sesami]